MDDETTTREIPEETSGDIEKVDIEGQDVFVDWSGLPAASPIADHDDEDKLCVLCYEREADAVVLPCGHGKFCGECLSRLAKRRCPTCRGKCKRVAVGGREMTVRGLAAERQARELRDLDETFQVVFVGGRGVRVKRIVERVCSGGVDWSAGGVFRRNGFIGEVGVRVGVVGRERGARRMVVDDVKCRRPDVLVVCWEVGKEDGFMEMLEWDRLLRMDSSIPRIWLMISKGEKVLGLGGDGGGGVDGSIKDDVVAFSKLNVSTIIGSIRPASLRPRAHYVVGTGNEFSIGLRCLMRDIVFYARRSRAEALETVMTEAKELSLRGTAGRRGSEAGGVVPENANASEAELVEAGRARMARMRQRDSMGSISGIIEWLSE